MHGSGSCNHKRDNVEGVLFVRVELWAKIAAKITDEALSQPCGEKNMHIE
jgi:hypothetical protein